MLNVELSQTPDNLKSGVRLARTGGHDQKQAGPSAGNGIQGAVDSDALVIAGRVGVLAGEIIDAKIYKQLYELILINQHLVLCQI